MGYVICATERCKRSSKMTKKTSSGLPRYKAMLGRQIINERGIDTENLDSVILIEPGVAYYHKSTAAIEIAQAS